MRLGMKFGVFARVFWLPVVLLLFCSLQCAQRERQPAKPIEKPSPADNSRCLVCHMNYEEGGLSEKHPAQKMRKKTCTDCHGRHRLAHRTRRWDKATGKLLGE